MKAIVDCRFPLMDASSAVFPTIRKVGADLFLAYHLPSCEESAVAVFYGVTDWSYGHPNDEGLPSHPFWSRGLTPYNFHEIVGERSSSHRWLATFHDGTFEIRAAASDVLTASGTHRRPGEALNAILGPGENVVLDER